jgi:hypothetical protein
LIKVEEVMAVRTLNAPILVIILLILPEIEENFGLPILENDARCVGVKALDKAEVLAPILQYEQSVSFH